MSPPAAADCPQFTASFAFVFRSSSSIEDQRHCSPRASVLDDTMMDKCRASQSTPLHEEQRQQYDLRPDRLTLGTKLLQVLGAIIGTDAPGGYTCR